MVRRRRLVVAKHVVGIVTIMRMIEWLSRLQALGLSGRKTRRATMRRPAWRVAMLERLEDRTMLTVVSNANDSGTGSLRQAIADTSAGGTITFDATFFSTARTITLSSQLVIGNDLTITGPGSALCTISGNNSVRCLRLTTGTVNISGLTFTNGFDSGQGGAISNSATLTLSDCVVQNSQSGQGGGIHSGGVPISIIRCTIRNNVATNFGGGISSFGTMTITDSAISGNSASGGSGGGHLRVQQHQ